MFVLVPGSSLYNTIDDHSYSIAVYYSAKVVVMKNPIVQIPSNGKSFTYFHTHTPDSETFNKAIEQHKSIELDISLHPDGHIYVGHPMTYYSLRGLASPNNVDLDQAIKAAIEADIFLVLDCKHIKTLPKIKQIIKTHGSNHFLFHSFCKELSFKPWPKKIIEASEIHWSDEELPLAAVLDLKKACDVPVALSCHGITKQRLKLEGEELRSQIFKLTKGKVETVNYFLPGNEYPPLAASQALLDNGYIPMISLSKVPANERPTYYIGTTDTLENATTS